MLIQEKAGRAYIPVIAAFDSNGNIIPLYVKIAQKELRIKAPKLMAEDVPGFIKFSCMVDDPEVNRTRNLILTFDHNNFKWSVSKRLLES